MVALTKDRDTKRRESGVEEHPVKAAARIFGGALVCLDADGLAVPGATAVGLTARGRADERADNLAGSNGARRARVRQGIFRWDNSAADEITRADIGKQAFIVDDQTVAKTNGGNTRSAAGTIRDVDAGGVWVETL